MLLCPLAAHKLQGFVKMNKPNAVVMMTCDVWYTRNNKPRRQTDTLYRHTPHTMAVVEPQLAERTQTNNTSQAVGHSVHLSLLVGVDNQV